MATSLSCTVGTPLPADLFIDGFGLGKHARIQQDPSGTLGGAISGTITNAGVSAPANYTAEAKLEAMGLQVVAGNAKFAPGRTLFDCKKAGPPVSPGQTVQITFRFGSGGCPKVTFASLPCGLYRETLTIRGVDKSGKRFMSRCVLYMYVPSAVKDIQLQITVNPNNLPIEPPSPPGFVIIDGINDRFNFIAPHFPLKTFTGNAVRVRVTGVPATSRFILSGKGTSDSVSGARTRFAPVLPVGQPNGVRGPRIINYVLNVPNTRFNSAPCNDIGPPPNYEAKLDATLTAISVERRGSARILGCVIKQATLLVSARFECR